MFHVFSFHMNNAFVFFHMKCFVERSGTMVASLSGVVLATFSQHLKQINQAVEIFLGAIAEEMQRILTKFA